MRRSTHLSTGSELALECADAGVPAAALDEALEAARARLDRPPPPAPRPLLGESAAMRDVVRVLERLRASDVTVLITGENGTGKELVARRIHAESSRGGGPFVAINASALTDTLLESELFGHRRGAFTDASHDKKGLFEVASGGSFFLDEVGDMSPALQVKLLRVLEERMVTPVGGTAPIPVDVRVIAATHRDLASLVAAGKFREDLYYRLNVVHVHVPALRERPGDVRVLAAHFLDALGQKTGRRKAFTEDALATLAAATWPGNVRELENEVERLWVLSGDTATLDRALIESLARTRGGTASGAPPRARVEDARTLPEAVETLERTMLLAALERFRGNKTRASESLGISRRNLIRKVQAYGLEALLDARDADDDA